MVVDRRMLVLEVDSIPPGAGGHNIRLEHNIESGRSRCREPAAWEHRCKTFSLKAAN